MTMNISNIVWDELKKYEKNYLTSHFGTTLTNLVSTKKCNAIIFTEIHQCVEEAESDVGRKRST